MAATNIFDSISILPDLPGLLPEFTSIPRPLPGLPPVEKYNSRELSYRNWVNHLRSNEEIRNASNIFEFDANKQLLDFGFGAKQILTDIAKYIRKLHLASMFCGDLVDRVFISLPTNTVSFPYLPISSKEKKKGTEKEAKKEAGISIEVGIRHDLLHFRYLVAILMNRLLRINKHLRPLISLPIDFHLFFSQIFAYMSDVQEASAFQLQHPIFFNTKQRIDFVKVIVNYRKQRTGHFDKKISLNRKEYKLTNWVDKVPKNSEYSKTLEITRSNFTTKGHIPEEIKKGLDDIIIPMYIRNVIEHYMDKPKGSFDESFAEELNYLFPGICSIFLDGVIRRVDSFIDANEHFKFMTMLEGTTSGFYLEPYRFIPLPADGDGGIEGGDYDDDRPGGGAGASSSSSGCAASGSDRRTYASVLK